jgi:hypothetical protein
MGFAFAELHWTPDTFWKSTLREVCTAYAHILPAVEINTARHKPFTAEEKQVLEDIKKKVERERTLTNGSK